MKIVMTVRGEYIAPRFDYTTEVIIVTCYDGQLLEEPRSIILENVSAERICDLTLKENADLVVCGGIEEKHYQFLTWKKIKVIDGVIGPYLDVVDAAMEGTLCPQTIFPGVTTWGNAS